MKFFSIKPNDTIELIAPASKFDLGVLPKAEQLLAEWGLQTKISCPMSESEWLCSTSAEERFAVLQKALADPEVKAIWAVWGGYGCSHLLPFLDRLPKPATPKLLMGFSDVTALHLFVNQKWNWPSLHCASVNQTAMNKISRESVESLRALLLGNRLSYSLPVTPMNTQPRASLSGRIVGGNLSIVLSTLATPWQIETKGKFLFLEETGEAAYRVDRMLHQLQQAGLLQEIKGLILGEFIQRETQMMDAQTDRLLKEWAYKLPVPVFSCKAGHARENYPIPLNCEAKLNRDHLDFHPLLLSSAKRSTL